jgi:hypothetical protein
MLAKHRLPAQRLDNFWRQRCKEFVIAHVAEAMQKPRWSNGPSKIDEPKQRAETLMGNCPRERKTK